MTNMLEKVAKVIEVELGVQEMVLADPITLRRIKATRIARAAVKALMGPTQKILDAGYQEFGAATEDEYASFWNAAIGAILSEQPYLAQHNDKREK